MNILRIILILLILYYSFFSLIFLFAHLYIIMTAFLLADIGCIVQFLAIKKIKKYRRNY